MLEQCCSHSKQCRNNIATLCCAKNRSCESSRVASPLRPNDADGNENVKKKKSNRFNKQNNNFARASHFFVHFFPFLHHYDVKMLYFAFYGRRKQATTKLYFPFLAWIWSFEIQLQEGSPTFDKVSG